jgi:DNA (cytosine-5)-methyltransferase 1
VPLAPRTCATAFSLSLHQATWPTPLTQDSKHAAATEWELGRPPQRDLLHVRVARRQMWPTPQASDDRDRGNLSTPAIQRRAAKGKQLNLSMVVSQGSGSLNPTWVEWLMGFPIGWTDLDR